MNKAIEVVSQRVIELEKEIKKARLDVHHIKRQDKALTSLKSLLEFNLKLLASISDPTHASKLQ